MIPRKTLLLNVAGFFVSTKELKERGFKFSKLLVDHGYPLIFLCIGHLNYSKIACVMSYHR